MSWTAALENDTYLRLSDHLLRGDGQEDLCFAVWHPSRGRDRTSASISRLVLPDRGDREVHGNASFRSRYFLRAAAVAQEHDGGLALLHSHPLGNGWQGMSLDDINAERSLAAQSEVLTGLPLVGLTMAGDGALSGRVWESEEGRPHRIPMESVRTAGTQLRITFDPALRPVIAPSATQVRTVSAWGEQVQADLARMRIGIVGAGSVGALVAELLARTGVGNIVLLDFDTVLPHNLDRLVHATSQDARLSRAKVDALAMRLKASATHPEFTVEALPLSVAEPEGFAVAADCDVLFSCVDRPWPRHVLNVLAYAHLIPVVDGGIAARATEGKLTRADWRAHIASPGRRCLACLGQYDVADVSLERAGYLDDPEYIAGIPADSPLKRAENVIGFSAFTAAMEVVQLLTALVAPAGVPDVGAHTFHMVGGHLDRDIRDCEPGCAFDRDLRARGDNCGVDPTGEHAAAEEERARRARQRTPWVRVQDRLDRWLRARLD